MLTMSDIGNWPKMRRNVKMFKKKKGKEKQNMIPKLEKSRELYILKIMFKLKTTFARHCTFFILYVVL